MVLPSPLASTAPWVPWHHQRARSSASSAPQLPTAATAPKNSTTGSRIAIRREDYHNWSSYNPAQDLIALLESEDEMLYRNAISAVLVADRFPFLSTTPFWIRILYSSLAFSSAAQKAMKDKLLWIQLQMMYYTHDLRVWYGSIHAPFIYWITHPFSPLERPPNWTYDVER